MRKNLKNYHFILLITILIFSSCGWFVSENDYNNILIPAKESNKGDYGFVNLDGEMIIDFDLDLDRSPSIMNEGISIYEDSERDNKVSFIYNNKSEVEIKETDYVQALLFNEGLALVVEGMGGLVYIDKEFNEVLVLDKDIKVAGYFIEGLAKFQDNTEKWGFIDKTGEIIIKAKYDYVESFSEGYAMVRIDDEDKKRGVIDKKGNVVIKLRDKYSSLSGFHNGLAHYEENDERGYINIKGEEVIKDDDWDYALPFHNDYATIREDRNWGLINKKGEAVIKNKYDDPLFFYNGLAPVEEDGEWGFINIDRDEIIDFDYKEALPFFGNGAYMKDGKDWIFINKKGEQQGSLELKFLEDNWIEYVVTSGYSFDVEAKVSSRYVAIDGLFTSTIDAFYNKTSLDKMTALTVKDAVDNIEQLAQTFQDTLIDSLENKLSVYRTKVTSHDLLDESFSYDKDFVFEVHYDFDDKVAENIIEKVQQEYWVEENIVGKKPNMAAKLKEFGIDIRLQNNAYGKGDFLKDKVLEYFKSQGFSEDIFPSKWSKKMQMSNDKIMLEYYQTTSSAKLRFSYLQGQE